MSNTNINFNVLQLNYYVCTFHHHHLVCGTNGRIFLHKHYCSFATLAMNYLNMRTYVFVQVYWTNATYVYSCDSVQI